MNQKQRTGPKIPTTQTNANRKRPDRESGALPETPSLLKKNEFTLIIVGALAVTVLAFFLFFKPSAPKPAASSLPSLSRDSGGATDLARRLEAIEGTLEMLQARGSQVGGGTASADTVKMEQTLDKLRDQVSRLEASVSLKFDSLNDRMKKMERKVTALKQAPAQKKKSTVAKKSLPKATPVVVATAPAKKTVKKTAPPAVKSKSPIFHTVQKGETLWSISQKYKTTVANIRKLNNLSADAKIYPGGNILVR